MVQSDGCTSVDRAFCINSPQICILASLVESWYPCKMDFQNWIRRIYGQWSGGTSFRSLEMLWLESLRNRIPFESAALELNIWAPKLSAYNTWELFKLVPCLQFFILFVACGFLNTSAVYIGHSWPYTHNLSWGCRSCWGLHSLQSSHLLLADTGSAKEVPAGSGWHGAQSAWHITYG